MVKIKSKALFITVCLLLALLPARFHSATNGDIYLIHGMKWGMASADIKSKEGNSALIDEFEMDRETTISYRSSLTELAVSNEWPMNLTYFLFDGKLYSILCNFLSTNEDALLGYYQTAVDHYSALWGRPKLSDRFRNWTAWETNGTVLSLMLGPTFMSYRKTMLTIQFDSPDSQDIRMKLDKIRNEQFREKELLTND